MGSFARGTNAIGDCMRCGFQYPLLDLRVDGRYPAKKLLVCESCWDPWDPQEHPWPPINDPIALEHPAPEVAGYIVFRDDVNNAAFSDTAFLDLYDGGDFTLLAADYGLPYELDGGTL